ncbi:transcriptional adapter 2A isoform X1 [Contarinia nasturtii]|uniref:transcriptional adapter 2A isoform X1 n=1 Tax=Contarinia nasturtii TaxID=265458 RepID=UPI0012D43771|nr:transcriptional adapter 2A isoform X1 [Contarinia nasturtii]
MSHVPVETAEEDAADLQFPKEIHTINLCNVCCTMLNEPYIACAECKKKNDSSSSSQYKICLKCFAIGAESQAHLSNHSYVIIHNDVNIFLDWPAYKDISLIELLKQFGFSNWSDISRKIQTYNAEECRDHYMQNYFDGIFWKTCKLTKYPYSSIEIPYLYRNSFDPPRISNMAQTKLLADYQFARSEFNTQFDVSAESIVSMVSGEWSEEFSHIGESLNCALVNAYNNRLRERHRRHKIVRQHGLILPNRTKSWLSKYTKAMNLKKSTDNQLHSGKFVAFMQLTSGIGFDRIVESLQYEYDLRKFLSKLYELRSKGITTCHGGRYFQNSKANRMSMANIKPHAVLDWKHISMNKTNSLSGTEQIMKHCMDLNQLPKKRRSTPLNIIGLSNYEKLTKDEQELCSIIRVIPDAYLMYKKLLCAENNKMGYLRLADARRLIKIDVNKTRVMYDFFVEHGYINKPS